MFAAGGLSGPIGRGFLLVGVVAALFGALASITAARTGDKNVSKLIPRFAKRGLKVSLIKHAHTVAMAGTGHLGSITRPDVFAGIVRRFLVRGAGSRDSAA